MNSTLRWIAMLFGMRTRPVEFVEPGVWSSVEVFLDPAAVDYFSTSMDEVTKITRAGSTVTIHFVNGSKYQYNGIPFKLSRYAK